MKNIVFGEDEVKLFFHKKLYDCKAIMIAAKEFSESCWVFFDLDTKDTFFVSLTPKTKDIPLETLGLEFFNYALGIQNAQI